MSTTMNNQFTKNMSMADQIAKNIMAGLKSKMNMEVEAHLMALLDTAVPLIVDLYAVDGACSKCKDDDCNCVETIKSLFKACESHACENVVVATKGKKKNGKTGYALYCEQERPLLKEQSPDLTFGEVSKRLGVTIIISAV